MATRRRLVAPPRVARTPTPGRLPDVGSLVDKSPEELVATLERFGISPDVEGIAARGRRATAKLEELIDSGVVPDDAALEAILDTAEKEFVYNLRGMTKTAIRLYKQSKLEGVAEDFMWLTNGGANICDSCLARHGEVRTMAQWKRLGLPGSAAVKCNINCNCTLAPVDG